MTTIVVVGSIIGTIVIAILSVMTLTEGYGFKHTIDPPQDQEEESINQNKEL